MSDTVIQRLLWKEYRVQRGFWLSMAGFAVACQVIVLLVPERTLPHAGWLFGLALGIPAFYALGCGATLFAAEREEGTLEQLRVLAVPSWKVWWSKLGFSVASTAGLLAFLWVLPFYLSRGNMLDAGTRASLWAVWGAMTVEFLAWGIFFSLLTKRPLNAACLAAVASLGSLLIVSWIGARGPFTSLLFLWTLQVLGLFALDAWIAVRWVLGSPARRPAERLEGMELAALGSLGQRVAVASVLAFAAILLLPVLVTSWTWGNPWRQPFALESLLKLSAVALAEAIAWGTFFSLRTRRTSVAAALASVIGFVSCQLLTIFFAVALVRGFPMRDLAPWLNAAPLRITVAMIVLLLDVWLALRWQATLGVEKAVERSGARQRPVSPLSGLVWQEGRQSWRTMAVFCGVALALLAFYRISDPVRDDFSFSFAIGVAGILSSLMGSCAFLAEQEGQHFRFFADRGVGPRRVWFAKQLIWFPAALVTAGVFCWISFISLRSSPRPFIVSGELLGTAALLPLITYSCGQFTSMLLVRGLVAGLMGLVLAFFVYLWLLLMQQLGVSLWWSVSPIPLVLLLATWLRAPDWMLERRVWRAWTRLIALLLVPVVGLPVAIAAHRVYEIPATGPGFSPEQVLRPVTRDDAETAVMYRHAIAVLEPHATPVERDWLTANRAALEITLQASRRASCVFYDPKERRIDTSMVELQATRELASLLLLEAQRLECEGELDAALECYLATIRLSHHVAAQGTANQFMIGNELEAMACERMPRWAAHPDQTPQRVHDGIRRLDELFRSAPPLTDSIKIEYLTLRRAMETDFDGFAADTGQDKSFTPAVFRRLIPCEYARAFRLLDYRTAESLQYVAEVNAALASGRPPSAWKPTAQAGYDEKTRTDRWARTTVVPGNAHAEYWGALPINAEARRRALRIILALKAWQNAHGDLPPTLDVLVGDYFERPPLDPGTAKLFGYAPRGFETPVRFGLPSGYISKPGQALLWTPGPNGPTIRTVGMTEDGYPRFEGLGSTPDSSNAGSAMVYPIP